MSGYGVIDIETLIDSDIVKPYAVGVYHNKTFRSFNVTDFVDIPHMYLITFMIKGEK
jgi:hypothetical protein